VRGDGPAAARSRGTAGAAHADGDRAGGGRVEGATPPTSSTSQSAGQAWETPLPARSIRSSTIAAAPLTSGKTGQTWRSTPTPSCSSRSASESSTRSWTRPSRSTVDLLADARLPRTARCTVLAFGSDRRRGFTRLIDRQRRLGGSRSRRQPPPLQPLWEGLSPSDRRARCGSPRSPRHRSESTAVRLEGLLAAACPRHWLMRIDEVCPRPDLWYPSFHDIDARSHDQAWHAPGGSPRLADLPGGSPWLAPAAPGWRPSDPIQSP
jgi:hypothetical protein